jgi:hypothetical protein
MLIASVLLVVAGVACLRTARHPGHGHARHAAAWACCGLVGLGLGFAALFALDIELIRLLRDLGKHFGWYGERRRLQEPLVLVVGSAAGAAALTFLYGARAWPATLRIALCASIGLLTLATVWGISFHNTDALLRRDVAAGYASGTVLTVLGALVLGGAALWERKSKRHQ